MNPVNQTIYYIDDDKITERQNSSYVSVARHLMKQPYYYVEFKLFLGRLPDVIPRGILAALIKGSMHLVLVNSHEAFHSIVSEIYNIAVDLLLIPPENITLFSESADIYSEVKYMANLRNRSEIKVVWAHLFELMLKSNLIYKEFNDMDILPVKKYTKSFLNFNRRWRLHRPTLVALFYTFGILDKGYVSLGEAEEGESWRKIWPMILHQNRDTLGITNLLLSKQEEICNLPPLYIDTENLIQNPVELEPETQYLYSETYFSVVSETNFYKLFQPGRFLSEKVFKPIAMYHPFIIVSVPNTLSLLRELGYKTFSPWINESYDEENDDNKRLLMVAKETKRLSNLTETEITEFINNVRNICIHNRDVLLNKDIFYRELN